MLNPLDTTTSVDDKPPISEGNTESVLNTSITREEVINAMNAMKNNKSSGIDDLPAEVLKNSILTDLLTGLFKKCFETGITPDIWKQSIISSVPKSSTSDPIDPLQYRGISLAPVMYKMDGYILNGRLSEWEEENDILHDAQNGFRKGRSTIDHLSTLTSIVETRKLESKATFAAFVDFRKAYDAIDRTQLFGKLLNLGINGKMYKALESLYKGVKRCVRLNNMHTDWFSVKCGLKQGCPLSPVLFNLYIDDLIRTLSSIGVGVKLDDGSLIAVLAYADDVVVLAESENDLQNLLNVLKSWCDSNKMLINADKSNIVHFRRYSESITETQFSIGETKLTLTSQYVWVCCSLSIWIIR